jgi:hypothetical protein
MYTIVFIYRNRPKTEGKTMSEMVTVNCWKCNGSGHFAIGACFGCGGTGTNTYTATAYARKLSAGKGRKTTAVRRSEAARAARDAELATKTLSEMIEEVEYMCCVGHDGLVEDFGGERITVEEMARRLMTRQAA